MDRISVGYNWLQSINVAVGTLCAHASGSAMHVLDHALLHTSTPCVSAACVYASQARFTLPKLGHQHVELTDGIELADSCGLMLTVKGMFTHTLWGPIIQKQGDVSRAVVTDAQRSLMQTS